MRFAWYIIIVYKNVKQLITAWKYYNEREKNILDEVRLMSTNKK